MSQVVISGMSGYFPQSDSIEELQKNLFDKINLVSADNSRWPPGELGVPVPIGMIKEIYHFDTTFFGIHRRLCTNLDVMTKLVLERAYEAIIDAGVNPSELNGTNTAVIMASCIGENEYVSICDKSANGFSLLGHSRTMQANRLSYFLNLKGPSFSMDSSWIGGMQGLQMGYKLVADGHCPAALVGVVNLVLFADISLQYLGLGLLNYHGQTRSFSADANGYSRGEACVVFFLQKAEDCKRSYGTIVNVGIVNMGSRKQGLVDKCSDELKSFLEDTYTKAGIDPSTIGYLEADGSGVKLIDSNELNGVAQVMCINRVEPLLVGSIKSNLGHCEGASSLVSLVKGITALDKGMIPPNLHYSAPNPTIPALMSGKIKVVTETTPLPGNIVGINSFGLGIGYGHVILKQNPKKKNLILNADNFSDGLPRLFMASARNQEGITKILDKVSNMPIDEEFLALSNSVWSKEIAGHLYRGYLLLPVSGTPEKLQMTVEGGKQRPVWFIFSGMGSQWTGMGLRMEQGCSSNMS